MWLIYARNKTSESNAQIDRVKWRKAKAIPDSLPAWDGPEEVVTIDRVVETVKAGEPVGTLFHINGHSVAGPQLRVVDRPGGFVTVEVQPWAHEGQDSLFCLPEFD